MIELPIWRYICLIAPSVFLALFGVVIAVFAALAIYKESKGIVGQFQNEQGELLFPVSKEELKGVQDDLAFVLAMMSVEVLAKDNTISEWRLETLLNSMDNLADFGEKICDFRSQFNTNDPE